MWCKIRIIYHMSNKIKLTITIHPDTLKQMHDLALKKKISVSTLLQLLWEKFYGSEQ
jgi:hypothetical protein